VQNPLRYLEFFENIPKQKIFDGTDITIFDQVAGHLSIHASSVVATLGRFRQDYVRKKADILRRF
jgi:hypothetical protein